MDFVHETSGKIHLCMAYIKLNSIIIWDAFPLPNIDKALEVMHNSNVYTSIDLVQGYWQMVMKRLILRKLHS